MRIAKGNKGLTILEILVALLILALIIGGLANIFISSKWYLIHGRSLMTAAELARYFLDPLHGNVSQETWNTTSWLGTGGSFNDTYQTKHLMAGSFYYNYTSKYNITVDSPIGNLTKVVLNITWNEVTP
ncbi:MAG: prepilin-type N-terminal cleavage/methylation domain-containing protein [Candidatus Omnitrophota bacterium]